MIITIRQFNLASKEFEDKSINCGHIVSVEKNGTGSLLTMENGEKIHMILGFENATNTIRNALSPTIILSEDIDTARNN
jgi:hypothetical protein